MSLTISSPHSRTVSTLLDSEAARATWISPGADASTVLYSSPYNAWWPTLYREILSKAARARVAETDVLMCLSWLSSIPKGISKPFFAIGDDNTLGLEWDDNGCHLFIMFGDGSAEAYFEDENGDEWESSLYAAQSKLESIFPKFSVFRP